MTQAGVNFQFRVDASGDMVGSFGSFIVGQTNDEGAASYLGQDCGGFKLKPSASPERAATTGRVIPAERICLSQRIEHSGEESFQFNLPTLPPPDYVSSRLRPADATKLQEAVDTSVREQLRYQKTCKSATVRIPYYSSSDPSVFVYVDMGPKCEIFSGMFDFRRLPDGTWELPGKLWGISPPNGWSWTIQQIKRTTLAMYEVR